MSGLISASRSKAIAGAFVISSCAVGTIRIAYADVVTDWNQITYERIAAAGGTADARPGPSYVVDVAAVQLAVYDAVQSYSHDYQPYLGNIPNPAGSVDAAAATAARDVLIERFPLQSATIMTIWENYMNGHTLPLNDPGCEVGEQAAQNLNDDRSNDGYMPPLPWEQFFGNNDFGQWRSTAPMAAVWLGDVRPFTLKSVSQFLPPPPPALNSNRYLRDLTEVRLYGGLTGSLRSGDQSLAADFWNLNYPGVFGRMVRELSVAHVANVSESSKLLAATAVTTADALITTWHAKKLYNYWRPSTHIKMDLPSWQPLIPDPPYPDYPSGANTVAASATRASAMYFGTNEMAIDIKKTNTIVTSFGKFSDVRSAVVDARVWQGIHFRFADEAARTVGERVAGWVHSHYFRPVD
jgi:hypothetical protein